MDKKGCYIKREVVEEMKKNGFHRLYTTKCKKGDGIDIELIM